MNFWTGVAATIGVEAVFFLGIWIGFRIGRMPKPETRP